MPHITPSSAEDLAQAIRDTASNGKTISLIGNNTKRLMAGPLLPADVTMSTSGLHRVLQYEPNDLTISVEAGMGFRALQELLGRNRQMLALDPPFWSQASVGGVIASNSAGPMRRAFGTSRDLVIGMKFATLEGKVVSTGGMVVKNVAGLDMGKLMVGSFGTLAVITSVNLRLHPLPERTTTFLFSFAGLDAAIEKRDSILRGVLRPLALDLLSPSASARLSRRGYLLALRAGGSYAVIERSARELAGSERLTGIDEEKFWVQVREFTPDYLKRQPNGIVLRVSTTLSDVNIVLRSVSGAAIARAASGVTYVYLSTWQGVSPLRRAAQEQDWGMVVEHAPDEIRAGKELWLLPSRPAAANAFAMMKKVKQMFDPNGFLNRLRLYGRI
ncbi:MAG TPA: FAD-binding oxidoreductase [Bryobacteraceae bacterium]|jgi:glycolate oxidase FAD binding subunit